MLILCGSVSSWIQKNIVSSTTFLGRPSWDIKLEQLSLPECNQFWPAMLRVSPYEKLKILSVTGGVPRYLEEINPHKSAEDNIRRLLFKSNSILLREFDSIFSDTFGNRMGIYRNIIQSLLGGRASMKKILEDMQRSKTGDFSEYLSDLVAAGFVARDYTWDLETGDLSKLSNYRLKDNFIRFYLRYVEPNRPKIESGMFNLRSLGALPAWDPLLGLQFENLVVSNSREVIRKLGIPPEDVVFANPYFQMPTKVQPGCQVDLAIQTRFNTLYVCELRLSKSVVKTRIIAEVEDKISRMKLPHGFSIRPVLIHVNGVSQEVIDRRYFADIVDFGRLLAPGSAP